MIYLTNPPTNDRVATYQALRIGVMLTPVMGSSATPGLRWAADTGCFKDPDGFDLARYLTWLGRWTATAGPGLFATAPDVLGDPLETWRRSAPVLPVLRQHGYAAALVSQDGLTDPDWDAFDCLFTGGTTHWKLSEAAYQLAAEARTRGKWVHMGRVNSAKRYLAAKAAGYHSADGTFVGFGPDIRLPEVGRWIDRGQQQPSIWEATG